MKKIPLRKNCLICDNENTGFRYTCESCAHLLPFGFYISYDFVPKHIPKEQFEQYTARYIIKNYRPIKE